MPVATQPKLVEPRSEPLNEGRDSFGVFKGGTGWATIFGALSPRLHQFPSPGPRHSPSWPLFGSFAAPRFFPFVLFELAFVGESIPARSARDS